MRTPNDNLPDAGTVKFLKLSLQYWWFISLLLIIFVVLLLVGAMVTPWWVEQGEIEERWRGGLLKCDSCSGNWEGKYYYEIKDDACRNDNDGFCETFERLNTAGFCLFGLELLVLCCVFFWGFKVVCNVWEFSVEIAKLVVYSVVVTGIAVHVLAVGLWFFISESSLNEDDCKQITSASKDETVCVNHGPYIEMFVLPLLLLIAGLHLFLDYRTPNIAVTNEYEDEIEIEFWG